MVERVDSVELLACQTEAGRGTFVDVGEELEEQFGRKGGECGLS